MKCCITITTNQAQTKRFTADIKEKGKISLITLDTSFKNTERLGCVCVLVLSILNLRQHAQNGFRLQNGSLHFLAYIL